MAKIDDAKKIQDPEAAKKTAEDIIAEAKRKADEIIKAAQAKVQANVNTAPAEKAKTFNKDDPMRPVTIKLFKDNGRYKDPLFVGVNSYTASIPRGIPVTVPYYVAKHIEEMQAQDESTAALISKLSADFESRKEFLEE